MTGQGGLSSYGKGLKIGKSTVDLQWTAAVSFLQHGVIASEEHSSMKLELCSKFQNAKFLVLYKYLTSPIFICSSNLRKVDYWVLLPSRNYASYFHILFCCVRATWTFYI